ncbi:MAG: hypothetical protein NC911_04185 [Candidatus Omnitrophica bacterium]|nr:hypothetical protein [Candidatus Omnitrophota bacterium]
MKRLRLGWWVFAGSVLSFVFCLSGACLPADVVQVRTENLIVEARDGSLSLVKTYDGTVWLKEPEPNQVNDGQLIGFGVNDLRKNIFLQFVKELYRKEGRMRKGECYPIAGPAEVMREQGENVLLYKQFASILSGPGQSYRFSLKPISSRAVQIGVRVTHRQKEMLYVTFGAKGIPDKYRIIIPADGGLSFDGAAPYFQWAFDLEVPLVIIQGKGQGIVFQADDHRLYGATLFLKHSPGRFDLCLLSAEADANAVSSEFTAMPWQITYYQGDWTVPAKLYRQKLAERYHPKALAEYKPSWVRDIRVLIECGPHQSIVKAGPSRPVVDKFSALFGGQHLVFFCFQDEEIYPAPLRVFSSFASNAEYARKKGARVLIYNSYRILAMPEGKNLGHFLCAQKYPDCFCVQMFGSPEKMYAKFLPHIYDRYGAFQTTGVGDPMNSKMGFVRLGFKPWQDIIISTLKTAAEQYHIDGCFFDTSGAVDWDNPSLPVPGVTEAEGTLTFWRELAARLPELAFISEGISESVLAGRVFSHMFFPQWTQYPWKDNQQYLHPVSAYIWRPYLWGYAYNKGIDYMPEGDTPDVAQAEIIGLIPVLPGNLEHLAHPSVEFLVRWAQIHSQRELKRVYPDQWEKDVCSYYQDKDGIPVRFEKTPEGDRMVEVRSGKTKELLKRFHNQTEAVLRQEESILRWPAYNGNQAIGLLPANWYPCCPAPRYHRLVISQLPPDAAISGLREGTNYLVIRLAPVSGKAATGTLKFYSAAPVKAVLFSDRRPSYFSSSEGQLTASNSTTLTFLWALPEKTTTGFLRTFTPHALGPDGFDRYLTYPDGFSVQNIGPSLRVIGRPRRHPITADAVILVPAGNPSFHFTPLVIDDDSPGTAVDMEVQINGYPIWSATLKKAETGREVRIDAAQWQDEPGLVSLCVRRRDGCWTSGCWENLRLEPGTGVVSDKHSISYLFQ